MRKMGFLKYGIVLIVLVLASACGDKYDWKPNMKVESDKAEPYNFDFLYSLLKKKYKNNYTEIKLEDNIEKLRKAILVEPENTVYFYAGKLININKDHETLLDSFVAQGGTVFLSAPSLPDSFYDRFNMYYTDGRSDMMDSVNIRFNNVNLTPRDFVFFTKYKDKRVPFSWKFIDMKNSTWQNPQVASISGLGFYSKFMTDFFRIKYGEGHYYFHLNSILLSNYFMTQSSTRPYFGHVLSHINKKRLIVDHTLRMIKIDDKIMSSESESKMEFITKNKSLRFAGILLILGIFSFLILSGKRKQTQIPVLEKPKNNTFRFIQTISYFYWTKNSKSLMYDREINQFIHYLKEHLNIKIDLKEAFPVDLIMEKSGVSKATLDSLAAHLGNKRLWNDTGDLAGLCKDTGKFYEEHKKHNGKYIRTRADI